MGDYITQHHRQNQPFTESHDISTRICAFERDRCSKADLEELNSKFLQEIIIIAFDFVYGKYCSPIEILLPFPRSAPEI